MAQPTIKAQYIREYILKYPKHSNYNIARLLCLEHPMLFDNLEKTRSAIRYYKGKNGDGNRKYKTAFYDELRKQV